ncbi:MAG: hypothetical protein JNL49_02840 [Bacteroidia bacterium]|nr:hypothetical protein [Bacteroidia bacterium]
MTTKQFIYQCEIKPISHYFFGGESSYNPADGGRENYFVRSMLLPQQTTILGTLRYAILNGFIDINLISNSPDFLIGPTSFNGRNDSFGIIRKLSPVYILHKNKNSQEAVKLTPLRKDFFQSNPNQNIAHLITETNAYESSVNEVLRKETVSNINFNHKQYYFGKIWTNKNKTYFYTEQDIFKRFTITSNAKNTFSDEPLDGYFKKEVVKLLSNFSFGVDIVLSERLSHLGKFICKVGGEGSLFSFEVRECSLDDERIENSKENYDMNEDYRLTAISPLKVGSEFMNYVKGGMSSLIHFRNIRTSTKTINYAGLAQKDDLNTAFKGGKETFYDSGSVFYIHGSVLNEAIRLIEAHPAYSLIGYNQFTLEKI